MASDIAPAGRTFGRLAVLGVLPEPYIGKDGQKYVRWRCRCQCGREKVFLRANLLSGHARSCGCLRRKWNQATYPARRKLRALWRRICHQCYDPGAREWQRYGGRGIRMCDRWLGPQGVENFIADVGDPPAPQYRLLRIDGNGDYQPANCRWGLGLERDGQAHQITFDEKTHAVVEWARMRGLKASTIRARLKMTADPAKILSPVSLKEGRRITHDGQTHTVVEWARLTGLKPCTVRARMKVTDDPGQILRPVTGGKAHRPGSCPWITYERQTHTVTEWARLKGLRAATIRARMRATNNPSEILRPVGPRGCKPFLYEFRGERRSLSQWSQLKGIAVGTLTHRLNLGWTFQDAISKPPRKRTRQNRKSGVAPVQTSP